MGFHFHGLKYYQKVHTLFKNFPAAQVGVGARRIRVKLCIQGAYTKLRRIHKQDES